MLPSSNPCLVSIWRVCRLPHRTPCPVYVTFRWSILSVLSLQQPKAELTVSANVSVVGSCKSARTHLTIPNSTPSIEEIIHKASYAASPMTNASLEHQQPRSASYACFVRAPGPCACAYWQWIASHCACMEATMQHINSQSITCAASFV